MQNQIHFSGNTAYWKTRKLGIIIPSESTFCSVSRTKENIFHLFGGLGINKKLLIFLMEHEINFIEVPFCGQTLKTTTNKYLSGIPLPEKYCSDVVDLQLFLRPDQINMSDEPTRIVVNDNQLLLFGRI